MSSEFKVLSQSTVTNKIEEYTAILKNGIITVLGVEPVPEVSKPVKPAEPKKPKTVEATSPEVVKIVEETLKKSTTESVSQVSKVTDVKVTEETFTTTYEMTVVSKTGEKSQVTVSVPTEGKPTILNVEEKVKEVPQ